MEFRIDAIALGDFFGSFVCGTQPKKNQSSSHKTNHTVWRLQRFSIFSGGVGWKGMYRAAAVASTCARRHNEGIRKHILILHNLTKRGRRAPLSHESATCAAHPCHASFSDLFDSNGHLTFSFSARLFSPNHTRKNLLLLVVIRDCGTTFSKTKEHIFVANFGRTTNFPSELLPDLWRRHYRRSMTPLFDGPVFSYRNLNGTDSPFRYHYYFFDSYLFGV